MSQTAERATVLCPNGLRQLDDHELAEKVASLPLPPEDHRRAVLLTMGLVPGKYGLLRMPDRDWLMKKASAAGVLPAFKKRKKEHKDDLPGDRYGAMSHVTKGTLMAAAIIASQVPSLGGLMPAPIRTKGR